MDDEKEWKRRCLADATCNQEIRAMAVDMAADLREPSDPKVHLADLEAARRYLETCVLARSVAEVQVMDGLEYAALWARGALGAARYRRRGAGAPSGGSGPSRPARTRKGSAS